MTGQVIPVRNDLEIHRSEESSRSEDSDKSEESEDIPIRGSDRVRKEG